MATEGAGHVENVFQVGRTVLVGRGSDGREDHLDMGQALREVGGEVQASRLHVAPHKLLKSRLVDRDNACVQTLYLFGVYVHAGDVESHFGEAGPRYESYVTRSHDCNFHHNSWNFFFRNVNIVFFSKYPRRSTKKGGPKTAPASFYFPHLHPATASASVAQGSHISCE